MTTFSSNLLESAVSEISKLPGIGKKTAFRLALHLLSQDKKYTHKISSAITKLVDDIVYCTICENISDSEICQICSNKARNSEIICVVEDIRDVIAIEKTSSFNGLYHVLGGKISPMEGVSPNDLNIKSLISRVSENEINEIIFALSSTMEGDTTMFYIFKNIRDKNIKVTTISRGISVGDELEYADEITLGRSIKNRVLYEDSVSI